MNIVVNGNKARSEIGKVGREMRDTKAELEAVNAAMKRLERTGKTTGEEYQRLKADADRLNTTIDAQKKKLQELGSSLKLEERTLGELGRAYKNIKKLRDQQIFQSENWHRYNEELKSVRSRMNEINAGANESGSVIDRLSSKYTKLTGALMATAAAGATVFFGIKKATDEYARFDDVLADVMKTTNLNKQAVKELNAELEQFDTRTSQEDLLGLGRIAGKLGYSEISDITEFVRANNQIIVALNEDLGGNVEVTVNKIGKLVEIFKLRDFYDTEEAFLKVGSAINELGMASTANEGYMVEFARRMAGVAPLAGITIEQILGLGAALDQLGQTEEVSSTALSKLFLAIAKDAVTYSQYAKMEVNDFKNLLEKDFMGAFTKVLQGVKGSSDGINELAATLGDLGQDGGRVIGVIGSLANNVDILTESINLSSSAMAEGTSITDEYNIKNETAAAKLDRKRKEVNKLWRELGEKLWPAISSGNNLMIVFLRSLSAIIGFIGNNIGVISTLTFAIIAYYTAVQLAAKWEVITTTYMATKRTVMIALSGVYAILTGNISRATAAQRLLNITMAANPYGLAAAALVGVVAWLINIANRLSDAEMAQERVNEEMSKAKDISDRLKSSTQELNAVINDLNLTRYEQAKAFSELQKLYPDLLKDMSMEEFQAKGATESLRELNEARIEEEKAIIRSKYEKAIKDVEELTKRYDALKEAMSGNQSGGLASKFKDIREQLAVANEELKQYGKQVEEINRVEFNAKPLSEKIEYYNQIKNSLVEQINSLEKQDSLIDNMNRGWGSFANWVNNIRMDGLVSQLNAINKQISSLTPKTTEEREKEIKTIGDRRKALNEELSVLKQQYELIGEKDIAARNKNLANRKRIQSQLDALDGNSSKGSNKVESTRKKAYKKELEVAEKHHQELLQKEGLFREDLSELTKEQLNELAKHQSDYQTKLDLINTKYGENLKTVTNTAAQELKRREKAEDTYISSLLRQKQTEAEAERTAFNERLEKAGLFGIDREQMTERQLQALEILEKQHQSNINKIDTDAMTKHIDERLAAHREEIADLKIQHQDELNEITTLQQAKDKLRGRLSASELKQITSLRQARRLIQNQQQLEEQAVLRGHLEELARIIQDAGQTGLFSGLDLADNILSDEEKELLKKKLREIKEELSKLKGTDQIDEIGDKSKQQVDIFGMSSSDWEILFENIRNGKIELTDLLDVMGAVTNMYSQYSNLVAQKENAMLQNDQASNDRKKENLKKRLDAGTISQETYNKEVEKMDKALDKKRAEIQLKQAKREKAIALMSAIVNTAKGVTASLPNLILAAIVAAFGAIQIGTIASTPLPSVEGRSKGGRFKVERAQDGRTFDATLDPDKRGYVSTPTVLAGESGKEWVASNEMVTNPFTAPIIDWLDTVQRQGQINPSTFGSVVRNNVMPGRQQGGRFNDYVSSSSAPPVYDSAISDTLVSLNKTMKDLDARLANLKAEVSLIGKKGFLEAMDEYNQIEEDANF